MSRPTANSPPSAFSPVASTSTAHLGPNSMHGSVRHRHDKEPMTYPPSRDAWLPAKTQRRKRRDTAKRGRKLRWRKGLVTEAFRRFGEHCARNQIRTLLIDCLVMTNLFYPSLALYLQKRFPPLHSPAPPSHNTHRVLSSGHGGPSRQAQREHPLSLLSTPVLDSFFPYPPPLLPRLTWAGWWGRDTGQTDDEGWGLSRDLPPGAGGSWADDEEIRVVRVGWADVEDILDRDVEAGERSWEQRDDQLLRLIRDVAEEWELGDPTRRQGCVRQIRSTDQGATEASSPCLLLSPYDEPPVSGISLLSLNDLDSSSHRRPNTTIPEEVPFGWAANAGNIYHSFAALFRIPRDTIEVFEARWTEAIANVAKTIEGEVFVEAKGSRAGGGDQTGQWYLSYHDAHPTFSSESEKRHSHPAEPTSSSPPKLVLFLYVVLFTTLLAQLSNASKVHSRFGLAFTGIVQLCCSAVMSFSVLALLGWHGWVPGSSTGQSSLPTYLLPFVIVVVGAENMSTLTKAIFSIPFNHSVPVRIGLGLSKVGTTIALTSLTDLLLLGVVWLCVNLQPVREFCLFAAVVIITDWFMLHTFFLTVLSIDAQRLELADVLASNGVAPISPATPDGEAEADADGRNAFSWRNMLRARTSKSGSLFLLLITVGILYWLTERHRIPLNTTASLYGYTPTETTLSSTVKPTPFVTTASELLTLPKPAQLWRAINPAGLAFARIVIAPASILVLPKIGHPMRPADIRKLSLPAARLLLPRLRPLFYLFKVVVLPQAVTAGALYILLLYLLKDADLLDAQRDRMGRVDEQAGNDTDAMTDNSTGPAHSIVAHMLPCSHESDVDIIVSSSDGLMGISVGVDNSVCLWNFNESELGSGTREPISADSLDAEDPIVAAAIRDDHRYVCVCTAKGIIQTWECDAGNVKALSAYHCEVDPSPVVAVAFDEDDSAGIPEDPFTVAPTQLQPQTQAKHPQVLVAFANGAVAKMPSGQSIVSPDSSGSVQISLERSGGSLAIVVIRSDQVDVFRKKDSEWLAADLSSTLTDDRITCVSPTTSACPGMYVLGHRSGTMEVIDEVIGHMVTIGPSAFNQSIRKVELVRPTSMRCVGCGTVSTDGHLIISSTSRHTYIDRVAPRSPTAVFCKCIARRGSSLDDPASPTSPLRAPPSRSSLGNILVVPPSATRRRYSPGTSPRKSPSLLPPVSNGEFPLSSHGGARRLSNLHRPEEDREAPGGMGLSMKMMSPVPNAIPMDRSSISGSTSSPAGEMDVVPLGAIASTDGGWIIQDDTLVGVRRAKDGIDDSQWSVYAVDLTRPFNGFTLMVDSVDLSQLVTRTQQSLGPFTTGPGREISMRDRRTERLHSLNGRAAFPERVGSLSVPTYAGLGYVEVREVTKLGSGLVGAFGNKLGVLHLPDRPKRTSSANMGGIAGVHGLTAPGGGSSGTPTPRRQGVFPLAPPPPPSGLRGKKLD
ncbi:hypothetical protein IAU60_000867 [Kwoniella sp. DSM 27419]